MSGKCGRGQLFEYLRIIKWSPIVPGSFRLQDNFGMLELIANFPESFIRCELGATSIKLPPSRAGTTPLRDVYLQDVLSDLNIIFVPSIIAKGTYVSGAYVPVRYTK